ncbi:hypothetical protein [Pseudomonas sp. NPDC096950]|uniref:hypothetical protein n=1 Tax=Pseudomonas sp. NPDC096950 TaxID=3364485 RepID=UPI00383BAE87
MDIELGIEPEELEIAGTEVKCLIWDMDDAELAVRELALYPHFHEHFREAFDLIGVATSFWLEDGSYATSAESVTRTLFRLRDAIGERASSAEAASLPNVIRGFLGIDHPATDSQLAAAFALVLGVQAVEILSNWLFELEVATYDIDADLIEGLRKDSPRQYAALIDKERDRRSGLEIEAREQFAVLKGEANQTLMMASLYRQVESIDVSKNGFNTSSLMLRLLDEAFSAKASKRGQEAGKGNQEAGSKTQIEAMDRRSNIKVAAEQIIAGRRIEKRNLTDAELTNLLFDQAVHGTKKTIRDHLTALGLRPLK